MYSKDELTAKNVATLKGLARQMGVKLKAGDNKENIVYAILDAQAEGQAGVNEETSASEQPAKRKRTRITAKKDDKVYSVKGKKGENYDVIKNQASGPLQPTEESLFKNIEETAPMPQSRPQHLHQKNRLYRPMPNRRKLLPMMSR